VCQRKNSENRSITGKDMDKNKVPRFLLALGVCAELQLPATIC